MGVIVIFTLFGIAVGLIVYSVMPQKQNARDSVKRRLQGRRALDEKGGIRKQAEENVREQFVKKASPMLSRLIMPTSAENQSLLRAKFTQAGYRSQQAPTIFLATKTAVLVAGLLAGAAAGPAFGLDIRMTIAVMTFTGGIGFVAPGFWLDAMIRARQNKLRQGLPDFLDLLVVSVESGLALDAGLKRVGEEMAMVHAETSEEFRIATMEAQMGIPRSEALENMATRTGLDELRSFVSVITQAERFGTSVSKALRNQGEAMRTKRRQAAEEKAQKTAVKLMIPLVMFIFPAMGVVLAGPAAINLMEAFGDK